MNVLSKKRLNRGNGKLCKIVTRKRMELHKISLLFENFILRRGGKYFLREKYNKRDKLYVNNMVVYGIVLAYLNG